MSFSFTDDQLKSLSNELISLPADIIKKLADKDAAILAKADIKKKDDENKVFMDNFENIIHQYHKELSLLNGILKTDYSVTDLDNSARLLSGNKHFDLTNAWFNPKVDPSNIGSPQSQLSSHEQNLCTDFKSNISTFTSGFNDGSQSDTVVSYSSGVLVASSPFPVGNRIVINSGGASLYGVVLDNASTSGGTMMNLNVIVQPNGSISNGATITNYFSGFNNSQRESLFGAPYQDIFNGLRSTIDSQSKQWKDFLSNQLECLKKNDSKSEKSQIDSVINSVTSLISSITSWQNSPSSGSGVGRYGDSVFNPFISSLNNRVGSIPGRVSQISNALGSIAQGVDGKPSGAGHYYNAFKWIDLRINKMTGTLRSYYDFDLGLQAIDQQVVALQNKKSEIENIMLVSQFAEDASNSYKVKLKSTSGLLVGDTVKIMSNDQPVILATITGISLAEKSVVFDKIIMSNYVVGSLARVLKVK